MNGSVTTALSAFRVGIVNLWVASRHKPLSRKLVRSLLTSSIVYLVALAVTRLGLKVDEYESSLIALASGQVAGFLAGWVSHEFPQIVADDSPAPVPAPVKATARVSYPVRVLPQVVAAPVQAEPVKPAEAAPAPVEDDAPTVSFAAPLSALVQPSASSEAAAVVKPAEPHEAGPRTVTSSPWTPGQV